MNKPKKLRRLRAIRRHIFEEFEDASSILVTPRHSNTRRRRRLARTAWLISHYESGSQEFSARFGADILENAARHCIQHVNQGGSIKAYSAWSGIRVRHLSKAIHRVESLLPVKWSAQ